LNWIIGPAVMFALAWLLLPDQPAYRTGVILVGLARCIAMVLIWTDLASGDREMAAILVALNAVFQVLVYAALGVFYLNVLPGWLGLPAQSLHVSFAVIAVTVLVFLGIPLAAGYLTRTLGERYRGREWYESRLRLTYARTASLAFSAASNDFELAIAVAIGVFGATSGQALAGVVGPLIEVPVLLGLVYVALWLRRRLAWPEAVGAGPAPTDRATQRAGTGKAHRGAER
jgi:ACR3 family arsenite efflux pump ArsB